MNFPKKTDLELTGSHWCSRCKSYYPVFEHECPNCKFQRETSKFIGGSARCLTCGKRYSALAPRCPNCPPFSTKGISRDPLAQEREPKALWSWGTILGLLLWSMFILEIGVQIGKYDDRVRDVPLDKTLEFER